MGKYSLEVEALLENCHSLTVARDFAYRFSVKCDNCGEVCPNPVQVCLLDDKVEMPGSRGTAHLVIKCKFCSRVNSLDIISDDAGVIGAGNPDDASASEEPGERGAWVARGELQQFEARGIEPVSFEFAPGDWIVTASKNLGDGTRITDVDLSDDTFADYDADQDLPFTVSEFSAKFIRQKGK